MRWQTKKPKILKNMTKIITKYLPKNEVANRKSKNVDVLNLASHICYKLGGGCDAHYYYYYYLHVLMIQNQLGV